MSITHVRPLSAAVRLALAFALAAPAGFTTCVMAAEASAASQAVSLDTAVSVLEAKTAATIAALREEPVRRGIAARLAARWAPARDAARDAFFANASTAESLAAAQPVLLPHADGARLEHAQRLDDGRYVAAWAGAAAHTLKLHAADGRTLRTLALPGYGTISRLAVVEAMVRYEFSSFAIPPETYEGPLDGGAPTRVHATSDAFDTARFRTEEFTVPSADGTPVSVVVVAPRAPKALFVYANAAGETRVPAGFSPPVANWLEMGGAFAFVHTRGSGAGPAASTAAGRGAGKVQAVEDLVAALDALERRRIAPRSHTVAHASGHSTFVMLAAMARRPSNISAAWLTSTTAAPTAIREPTPAWALEYGDTEPAHAAIGALEAEIVAAEANLPALLLTGVSSARVIPIGHTERLVHRLAAHARKHDGVRVLPLPADPAAQSAFVREERVDVYTWLAVRIGLGRD